MSDFNEFIQDIEETNVEGSFDCQWCDQEVTAAFYDPVKKTLTWRCAEGHRSALEKFSL